MILGLKLRYDENDIEKTKVIPWELWKFGFCTHKHKLEALWVTKPRQLDNQQPACRLTRNHHRSDM